MVAGHGVPGGLTVAAAAVFITRLWVLLLVVTTILLEMWLTASVSVVWRSVVWVSLLLAIVLVAVAASWAILSLDREPAWKLSDLLSKAVDFVVGNCALNACFGDEESEVLAPLGEAGFLAFFLVSPSVGNHRIVAA